MGRLVPQRGVDLDGPDAQALQDIDIEAFGETFDAGFRERLLPHQIDKLATVFEGGPEQDRLLLAAQYLLYSWTGSDEILSYVRTAVALEALLGDRKVSDSMGLGKLLSNRCAYLVSRTTEEREMILKEFPAIYDVRSRIVHDGKKRLTNSDRELLFKLRRLCQRVIRKEIDLIRIVAPSA